MHWSSKVFNDPRNSRRQEIVNLNYALKINLRKNKNKRAMFPWSYYLNHLWTMQFAIRSVLNNLFKSNHFFITGSEQTLSSYAFSYFQSYCRLPTKSTFLWSHYHPFRAFTSAILVLLTSHHLNLQHYHPFSRIL